MFVRSFTDVQIDYGEPDDDMSTSGGDGSTLSLSPLAHKMESPKSPRKFVGSRVVVEHRPFIPDPSPLPSDIEDAQETEAEEDGELHSHAPSGMSASICSEDEMTRSGEYSETESEEDEDEWEPQNKTPKARRNVVSSSPKENTNVSKSRSAANPKTPWDSRLAQEMRHLQLDDSAIILPRYSIAMTEEENDEEDRDVLVKKKKRLVLWEFCQLADVFFQPTRQTVHCN